MLVCELNVKSVFPLTTFIPTSDVLVSSTHSHTHMLNLGPTLIKFDSFNALSLSLTFSRSFSSGSRYHWTWTLHTYHLFNLYLESCQSPSSAPASCHATCVLSFSFSPACSFMFHTLSNSLAETLIRENSTEGN